jgi:hypothetical protein
MRNITRIRAGENIISDEEKLRRAYMSKKARKIKATIHKVLIIIAFCIPIISLIGLDFYSVYGTKETVTIAVTDKAIKRYNESDKYIIYTDNETFEITDQFLLGRFNSSDDYGRLKVGETYTVTVNGWRVPFLSWYRNIIEINE